MSTLWRKARLDGCSPNLHVVGLIGKLISFEVGAILMKGGVKDGLAREVRKGRVLGAGQRVHQGGGRQDILRLHRLCGQVRSERH